MKRKGLGIAMGLVLGLLAGAVAGGIVFVVSMFVILSSTTDLSSLLYAYPLMAFSVVVGFILAVYFGRKAYNHFSRAQ